VCGQLIVQSSARGEVACDPFMGSGSIGVAAVKLDRRFVGPDVSEEAVEMTRERLEALSGGPSFEQTPVTAASS
jgi:site-specific DNA-methyltransferase (adenine-specific)